MKKTCETGSSKKYLFEHIEDIGCLLGYDPALVAEALYCYKLLSRDKLNEFDVYLENNSIEDMESTSEVDL